MSVARNLLVAAALLAALVAGVAMAGGWWTPWARDYVQGVDVSHHQGDVNWRALALDGIAFAYIKATEGSEHVDPRFAENWQEAADAGIVRGAYHYFTLCRPASMQAAHFIATVPYDRDALPPAVDLEHMGPCRQGPTMTDVPREARRFVDILEAHYGARPILYTTREFHDAHLTDYRGERFWLRSLFTEPNFRQRDWVFWQHHNGGRKRGISGPVDLNAFRGDAAAFAQFRSSETNS